MAFFITNRSANWFIQMAALRLHWARYVRITCSTNETHFKSCKCALNFPADAVPKLSYFLISYLFYQQTTVVKYMWVIVFTFKKYVCFYNNYRFLFILLKQRINYQYIELVSILSSQTTCWFVKLSWCYLHKWYTSESINGWGGGYCYEQILSWKRKKTLNYTR